MVEGNGVWRTAAKLRLLFLRRRLRASSPKGSIDASKVDGGVLVAVQAVGKSLFLHFGTDSGLQIVQLHFGMSGGFPLFRLSEDPGPRKTSRLRLESSETEVVGYMSGIRCQLLPASGLDKALAGLGPDPLRVDSDPSRAWRTIRSSARPIGLMLMDQAVLAGIGNIYRAEVLHRLRWHPLRPAFTLSVWDFEALWKESIWLLQLGARVGNIVTVLDDEWSACEAKPHQQTKSKDSRKRRWVYFRKTCLTCGGPVRCWTLGGRVCFACESCQLPWKDMKDADCELVSESGKTTGLSGPPSLTVITPDVAPASLPVTLLRQLLAERLLPTQGRKADLAKRFAAHCAFHDDVGFGALFVGMSASPAMPTKPATPATSADRERIPGEALPAVPWPLDLQRAKEFASIQCWRSQESIHAWVQQDPKRRRYGRLSGRTGKGEGRDFDFEDPEIPESLDVKGHSKAADAVGSTGSLDGSLDPGLALQGKVSAKRKVAEKVVVTPRKKRRQASPSSANKVRHSRLDSRPVWEIKFSRLSPSVTLDLCDF